MFTNNYRLSKPPIKGRRRRIAEREEVTKAELDDLACTSLHHTVRIRYNKPLLYV
jgi:hypothetical protein